MQYTESHCNSNRNFFNANVNDEVVDALSYQCLMGSILFLARQTGPNFLFGVIILSLLLDKLTKAHMQGAKRILRYLRCTSKLNLVYRKQEDPVLLAEVMHTGVAIKMIENQPVVFISSMASTIVLCLGRWESNKQLHFQAVKQRIKV